MKVEARAWVSSPAEMMVVEVKLWKDDQIEIKEHHWNKKNTDKMISLKLKNTNGKWHNTTPPKKKEKEEGDIWRHFQFLQCSVITSP